MPIERVRGAGSGGTAGNQAAGSEAAARRGRALGRATACRMAIAAGLAAGCGGDASGARTEADEAVREMMISVLEPAAMTYWEGVGEILEPDGVHLIRPVTEEDWAALREAASVVEEAGGLLMEEHWARGRGDWAPLSSAMAETGRLAGDAVESRDPASVFDAGAEMYYACAGCHARYATETLRPSDPRSQSPGGSRSSGGSR